jgi:hypothetical protein
VRATNVLVRSAAGEIRGEAELDLEHAEVQLHDLVALDRSVEAEALERLQNLLGGTIV